MTYSKFKKTVIFMAIGLTGATAALAQPSQPQTPLTYQERLDAANAIQQQRQQQNLQWLNSRGAQGTAPWNQAAPTHTNQIPNSTWQNQGRTTPQTAPTPARPGTAATPQRPQSASRVDINPNRAQTPQNNSGANISHYEKTGNPETDKLLEQAKPYECYKIAADREKCLIHGQWVEIPILKQAYDENGVAIGFQEDVSREDYKRIIKVFRDHDPALKKFKDMHFEGY